MDTTTTQVIISVPLTPEWKERVLRSGWGMFTPEGSLMVANTIITLIENGVVVNRTTDRLSEDFGRSVFEAVAELVQSSHDEVTDTEVREMIWGHTQKLID